jgi:integrase
VTVRPAGVGGPLRQYLEWVRARHERDVARGVGGVALPGALDRKAPGLARDWAWQWGFPATRTYVDGGTGERRRHHVHETVMQRAVRSARRRAGSAKRATGPTFRHRVATHRLEGGSDIRTVQELLGRTDVATTMIYPHVLNWGGLGVRSPADLLGAHGPSERSGD